MSLPVSGKHSCSSLRAKRAIMPWVAFCGALLAVATLSIAIVLRPQGVPFAILVIVATSVWATVDSSRLRLQDYRTLIALHPILLFNLMYLLWPLMFPWYLMLSARIRLGQLPKRKLHGAP